MARFCTLLTLLVGFIAGAAQTPAPPPFVQEVKTLAGAIRKGEVRKVSDQEVVISSEGKDITVPIADVVTVEMQPARVPTVPFLDVGLTDGTLLRCQALGLRGPAAEVRLFGGQAMQMPLAGIRYILCDAHQEMNRIEFEPLLAKPNNLDVLRLLSRDMTTVNAFEGYLGDADEQGKTINFKPDGGNPSQVALSRVRGLIFVRKRDDQLPAAIAKVQDVFGDVFLTTQVRPTEEGYQIKTVSGQTLDLPRALVQRFDFSLGKLAYLSDLDPLKVDGELIVAVTPFYARDKHLEGGPLTLQRQQYSKGLSVHARCVLEYDVSGYNTFRCFLGIDDQMEGPGQAVVRIEGDGKELFATPVTNIKPPENSDKKEDKPKEDKAQELELKITGMKRLRLTVDYGPDGDLGAHVDFAEARVLK